MASVPASHILLSWSIGLSNQASVSSGRLACCRLQDLAPLQPLTVPTMADEVFEFVQARPAPQAAALPPRGSSSAAASTPGERGG